MLLTCITFPPLAALGEVETTYERMFPDIVGKPKPPPAKVNKPVPVARSVHSSTSSLPSGAIPVAKSVASSAYSSPSEKTTASSRLPRV